ncbi:glycosyltransferase family 4 protein [Cellulomonas fimi]|uniref:glycosyltransferase family 4 protein n=1 Tax=Cellulomonas fimi TaxID=1708 RepID=UPI00234CA6B8|nr:glycosyltransferase family 4 protein [Cellulomonas fimi]MDC7122969.1 glycosyltransferase family 4 protein [Cellulomonas fimi]
MDVIVCGAQVPFVRGGAELHMDNIVKAMQEAGHRAELVHLPTAWEKDRLFDAPLAWRMLPLDADVVISTNFPSYYARHPRKVVWLFHQHRGAYDAIDAPWSDLGLDDDALEVQRQLTEWDTRALGEARHVFTTSHVVADRLARYNGLEGEALYHPPPLAERLHTGEMGDYVFTPTRLETNKRPDLIVDAMSHVSSPVRAVVAGRGSMTADLAARVERGGLGDRVSLPGFVPDDDLVEQYAGALGVIYAPFDEDYGYVTLQAFLAGKPVITSHDAGGVLEWVEDGVTGYVTDGTPEGVADAVERLAADRENARAMGEEGRRRASELSWPAVVERLLSASA